MTKVMTYLTQSLASSGLALANSEWAFKLRPDLWVTAQDCAYSFGMDCQNPSGDLASVPNVHRLAAMIAGADRPVNVLARSTNMLDKRISWLTGARVESIGAWQEAPKAARVAVVSDEQHNQDEKLRRLRELAEQEPPDHDCLRRRSILAARAELAA